MAHETVEQAIDESYWLDHVRDAPEYAYAWGHFADTQMLNTQYREYLQYMGTWLVEGKWVHQFRHRAVPGTNERKYWDIPASAQFLQARMIERRQIN